MDYKANSEMAVWEGRQEVKSALKIVKAASFCPNSNVSKNRCRWIKNVAASLFNLISMLLVQHHRSLISPSMTLKLPPIVQIRQKTS